MVALLPLLPLLPEVLGEASARLPVPSLLRLLLVVVVVRLALLIVLRIRPGAFPGVAARRLLLTAGSTAVAAAFAALNLAVVPQLDDAHAALLAMCHAGVCSVALVSMAGSLGGFLVYVALNLGTFLLAVSLDGSTPVRQLLAWLVVLFIVCLSVFSVGVHRGLVRSLRLAEQLGEAALRDSLTGLRNRRALSEAMAPLTSRVLATWSGVEGPRRSVPRESLAVLVLDLDRFKEVNDRFSHAAGDEVLVQLADRLRANTRPEDLVVRWGGEEFVLVVAGTDRGPDLAIAERIRAAVGSVPFLLPNGMRLPVTCSVGVSVFPFSAARPSALGWEEVVNIADLALRTAKQRGRNRSVEILCGDGALAEPETARSLVDGYLERAQEHGLVEVRERSGTPSPPA